MLADDHEVVRRGLIAFIETTDDIRLLAAAASGTEVIPAVERHAPDVVLLDLLMPGEDPVETVRQIKSSSPRSQIVILTSHEGDQQVVPLTRAGAVAYLLKGTSPDELITAIRHAHAGRPTLSPRVAASVLDAVRQASPSPAHDELTEREAQVLRAVAVGASNRHIAAELGITERTVKSHVSNILAKLRVDDRTQAAIYAWREGLMDR
ncbi:MAG: response regulator transcription factor [Acidobacteriota bacterium]